MTQLTMHDLLSDADRAGALKLLAECIAEARGR